MQPSICKQQCVKLNNVIAAIKQLDNVFNELNIKKGGDRINSNAVRYEPDPNFVTVAVTVVRAFDLPLVDSISADPFVRLIQNGQQVNSNTATKVIRRNLNPVWNEKWEFGVPLQYSRDAFDFEVCNEDNFGLASSKVIGKTRIQDGVSFNDRIFQDYLTHEMTFNLEPKGQLVVRVLRKGEIDDREFWVQKSMETLRFTAEKMIRVFTDKIVRFAEVMWTRISQQYKLSNSILGGLVGSKKDAAPVKDIEVEAALTPLLEYLDNNLTTFNENLDRLQLDRFLTDIYHYLGTDQASLKVETVDLTDFEAMSLNEASLDKPSLMALVVWHELVIRMNSSLGALHASGRAALAKSNPGGFTGKEPLGESEKRQVAALELVLEYLKAFFYCDLDGRCCGFPLKVLERGKYRDTRFLIESMLR
ncbi:C2 domain-containing protein [Chytriomyces sp. MP71]|nr:C2 domain-containing protein [Chytriomyces sp. MP71]